MRTAGSASTALPMSLVTDQDRQCSGNRFAWLLQLHCKFQQAHTYAKPEDKNCCIQDDPDGSVLYKPVVFRVHKTSFRLRSAMTTSQVCVISPLSNLLLTKSKRSSRENPATYSQENLSQRATAENWLEFRMFLRETRGTLRLAGLAETATRSVNIASTWASIAHCSASTRKLWLCFAAPATGVQRTLLSTFRPSLN